MRKRFPWGRIILYQSILYQKKGDRGQLVTSLSHNFSHETDFFDFVAEYSGIFSRTIVIDDLFKD